MAPVKVPAFVATKRAAFAMPATYMDDDARAHDDWEKDHWYLDDQNVK
jgi:hypothetical protein